MAEPTSYDQTLAAREAERWLVFVKEDDNQKVEDSPDIGGTFRSTGQAKE